MLIRRPRCLPPRPRLRAVPPQTPTVQAAPGPNGPSEHFWYGHGRQRRGVYDILFEVVDSESSGHANGAYSVENLQYDRLPGHA